MVPLFGGKGDLSLELDKRVYKPGERIEAKVTVTCNKDTEIEEGYAELICTGRYHSAARGIGTDLYHRSRGGVLTPLFQKKNAFAPKTTIYRGMSKSYTVTFDIPADAPGRVGGTIGNIKWQVKAVCDVRRGKDMTKEVEFQVQ